MNSGLKVKRRLKNGGKSREKNFKKNFVRTLLLGRKLSQAKNDLFWCKFFEFEEFFHPSFFLGSILPEHGVGNNGLKCHRENVWNVLKQLRILQSWSQHQRHIMLFCCIVWQFLFSVKLAVVCGTVFPHIVSAEAIIFWIWKSKGHST